jgi:hypothetical protein
MKIFAKSLFIVFLTALLTACPFQEGVETPAIPTLTTQEITTTGGQTMSGDQRLTLTFPSGALATPTDITITTLSAAEIAEKYPDVSDIDFVYELGPDGTMFTEPVEISFLLPEGTDLADPRAFATVSNGVAETLENVEYDPATGIVTGTLTHFSDVLGKPVSVSYTVPRKITHYVGDPPGTIRATTRARTESIHYVGGDSSFTPVTLSGNENIVDIQGFTAEATDHDVKPDGNIVISFVCNEAGIDTVKYRFKYADAVILGSFTDVVGTFFLETEVTCLQDNTTSEPEAEVDILATATSVIVGQGPEAVKKAGSPPYTDTPENTLQRFIVSGVDQAVIFTIGGEILRTVQLFVETFGSLYLQHSTVGDFVLAYGPEGTALCGVEGGFCQIDTPVFGNPSGNNTTSVEYGVDANGNQVFNQAFRVRNGIIGHLTENEFGFTEDDVFTGFLPNTSLPLFAFEPLTPFTGIGITADGHGYFIDHSTDTVTEFSDSLGAGLRDVECDQFSSGTYGCAIQSFDDATITPCGGTNASDFSCGAAVDAGDGVSLAAKVNDAGNLAVIGADYSDSSIHAIEFTPTFGLVLQAEFFPTQYLSIFSGAVGPSFSFLGHVEMDPFSDTIQASGNGSGNVVIIPIDELGGLVGTTGAGMTFWF